MRLMIIIGRLPLTRSSCLVPDAYRVWVFLFCFFILNTHTRKHTLTPAHTNIRTRISTPYTLSVSVCLCLSRSLSLSVCQSLSLSLSVYLSACLSLHLFALRTVY